MTKMRSMAQTKVNGGQIKMKFEDCDDKNGNYLDKTFNKK